MRILIATDTYHPDVNGAAYFTYRLAVMLNAKGHQVFVAAPSKSLKKTVETDEGVTVYGVPSVANPIYHDYRIPPLFFVRRIQLPSATLGRFKEVSCGSISTSERPSKGALWDVTRSLPKMNDIRFAVF